MAREGTVCPRPCVRGRCARDRESETVCPRPCVRDRESETVGPRPCVRDRASDTETFLVGCQIVLNTARQQVSSRHIFFRDEADRDRHAHPNQETIMRTSTNEKRQGLCAYVAMHRGPGKGKNTQQQMRRGRSLAFDICLANARC